MIKLFRQKNSILSVVCAVVALVASGVILFLSYNFSTCPVSGISMEPTLKSSGDSVLLTRFVRQIESGRLVVFDSHKNVGEDGVGDYYIKRIIATEGETLRFQRDGAYVDLYKQFDGTWEKLDEPYINERMTTVKFHDSMTDPVLKELYAAMQKADGVYDLTIPQRHFWAMGDNRNRSDDSRFLGLIANSDIVGTVVLYTAAVQDFIAYFPLIRTAALFVGYLGIAALLLNPFGNAEGKQTP